LRRWHLVLAVALLTFGCEAPRPTNVIVVLIDTLRSDHLGCYGYARPTSPNIDRIAAEGFVFDAAIAQSSWTAPSVASLFTSVYPSAHGVVRFGSKIPQEFTTLAEVLHQRGLKTAAFSANMAFVSPEKAFDQGFDTFEVLTRRALPDETDQKIFGKVSSEAEAVTDRVLRHLEGVGNEPFFLYVHYIDPHTPYDAPGENRDRFVAPGWNGKTAADFFGVGGMVNATDAEVPHLLDLYDGEIAYTDAQLGRLFSYLDSTGLMDKSLLVITSDHGEEFHDHGGFTHGTSLYREQVQVPLIVRAPGGGGRRVAKTVELVDVGPTVIEELGGLDERRSEGHSFSGSMVSEHALARLWNWGERVVAGLEIWGKSHDSTREHGYSELSKVTKDAKEPRHSKALRSSRWYYLLDSAGGEELYDNADIAQLHDQTAVKPELVKDMNGVVRDLARRSEGFGEVAPPDESLSEEERERLRALGYVD